MANDKIAPDMARGTKGLKDTLGSAMAQTSMRLEQERRAKEEAKSKAKKSSAPKKLKDTSSDYWTPVGTGDMGSVSNELGADMGQVNKGGYDASEGMKKGGFVHHSAHVKQHAAGFKHHQDHVKTMCGGGMAKGKK